MQKDSLGTRTYLGTHPDDRLHCVLKPLRPLVDMPKLGVPARVLPPVQGIAVRPQAVAQPVQQAVHVAPGHHVPAERIPDRAGRWSAAS